MIFSVVKIISLLFLDAALCDDLQTKETEKFKDLCLGIQNLFRAMYGAPPLQWDDTLAESSNAWANHLNVIQKMEHSTSRYGENLYASANPPNIDYICEYAMVAWFRERKKYDFNNPKFSEDTGHFTQMVWKSTTHIGIGEAGEASGNFYLVARYHPPGNMDGGFETNVLPKRKINRNCINKFGDRKSMKELSRIFNFDNSKSSDFVYNSSEPCDLNTTTTSEPTGNQEGGEGVKGAEGQTGNQGGTSGNKGTGIRVAKPGVRRQTVLLLIPIAEPVGCCKQPGVPSVLVTTAQQPVVSTLPAAVQGPAATEAVPVAAAETPAQAPAAAAQAPAAIPAQAPAQIPAPAKARAQPPLPAPLPAPVQAPVQAPTQAPIQAQAPTQAPASSTSFQPVLNPVQATTAFDPTPNKRTNLFKKQEWLSRRSRHKKK